MRGKKSLPGRLYRTLLFFYPRSYRSDCASEMVDTLMKRENEIRQRGRRYEVLRFWCRETWAVVRSGLSLRWGTQRLYRQRPPKLTRPLRFGSLLETMVHDVVFGLRTLKRRPLFTAVAVATLGLGIGVTTGMYSVVHAVLRDDVPYLDADNLVSIWQVLPGYEGSDAWLGEDWDRVNLTYPQFRRLKETTSAFQDVAAFRSSESSSMILTGAGEPQRINVGVASASLFRVLGLEPVIGRGFLPSDEGTSPGQAEPVVVLSHEMWNSRLAADPGVIGRAMTFDGRPYTVIGILPPNFRLRSATDADTDAGRSDIWVPIGQPGWRFGGLNESALDWEVVGRLASGATIGAARSESRVILLGNTESDRGDVRLIPRQIDESLSFDRRLMLLTAAVCILLLIACGNVTTLFLGEMHTRRQELATRIALGAGKIRIAGQLLTESAILGLLGSGLGVLAAIGGTQCLVAMAPPIPRVDEVTIDGSVLAFAVIIGSLAGLLSGTVPSLISVDESRGSPISSQAGRSTTKQQQKFQGAVVTAEVALTALLLICGGLLSRSLFKLMDVDPGFQAENLATVEVTLPRATYNEPDAFARFVQAVVTAVEASPTVISASGAGGLPFGGGVIGGDGLRIDGGAVGSNESFHARRIHVLANFHQTLGIPLLAGRSLNEADGPNTPAVMVINESFARRNWPDRSPIGETVQHWGESRTIVGVAGDVKLESLGIDNEPSFYVPLVQIPRSELSFIARTMGDPSRVLLQMREAVWSVDRNVPITQSASMSSLVARSAIDERYRTTLMMAFGCTAALLAIVGVFGVTARGVSQRYREMGIRLALGAPVVNLMHLIVRGSIISGTVGIAVGLTVALAMTRLLSGFLFGIESWDPLTYCSVAALLLTLTIAASYLPARLATKIDPMDVMRV